MKMIFRHNINLKKKDRKSIMIGALLALILVAVVFEDFSFMVISRPALYVIRPFLEMRGYLRDRWDGLKAGFREKESFQNENDSLREKIMQLETSLSLQEIYHRENTALKTAFSAEERQNYLLASVVLRPPQTSYDMLIVDSGSKDGVREGMQVSAFGNALLGYVADVYEDTSKVKLISSFGEETNVYLESSQTPAMATGRGGENLEITLPRAVKVNIGERAIVFGRHVMLVGIVEKIEQQATNPFQKILFRLPVNIQYLTQVFLLKK